MNKLLKIIIYAIPVLSLAALILLVFYPELSNIGPRAVLKNRLRASQNMFPCPDYEFVREHILSGGPPKDGIPAVNNPIYTKASKVERLDSERVFGVVLRDFIAAYPESIMVWHEVVNDVQDSSRISITYCPLTRSAIGFYGRSLGVTGTLYNSNLVMYDRVTHSRIPQILGVGVDGELCGATLPTFPVVATSWGQWVRKHPQTLVMTTDTGYKRKYGTNPYQDYQDSDEIYFPLTMESVALPAKSMVLGLEFGGNSAAVPVEGFAQKHPEGLSFILGGGMITVWWDENLEIIRTDSDVKQMEVFWFAWYAQHPETMVIK